MSTKSTIAYGEGFALYNDIHFFQDRCEDHVWLELEKVEFEVNNQHVAVKIPIALWEYLRTFSGVDLSDASKSDDEVRVEAEAWVDRHIKDHAATAGSKKSLLGAFGRCSPLGPADSPRAEQVARAVGILTARRESERKVMADIERLKDSN